MHEIFSSTYPLNTLENASELVENFSKFGSEKFLQEVANIYQCSNVTHNGPVLFYALQAKNYELVNKLLDVYDRDLENLKETNFKRALIAFPEDQTDEFMKTAVYEIADDVTPVLLKKNNKETPECLFLRNKLKDRRDLSYTLRRKLEKKNGFCDLNWKLENYSTNDSFLHLAVFQGMNSVAYRLLNNLFVNTKPVTSSGHSPLHYAIHTGNTEIINKLSSIPTYNDAFEDTSYLYHAAISGKQKTLDLVLEKIFEQGKSLEEVLKIPFSFESYENGKTVEHLLHVIARKANFLNFYESHKEILKEEDFYIKNSNGETILHLITLDNQFKICEKIKMIAKIVEKLPKLLLIVNNENQLPLHYSAYFDTPKQRLFEHLLKLTVNQSGDEEIFYSNIDAALLTVLKAIEINPGLSAEYLKNFERLLRIYGPQLLHKTISVDKKQKSLKGILSASVKINPNEFHEGTNGFLLLLKQGAYRHAFVIIANTYEKFQMLMDYHPIEDVNARDETGMTLFMYIIEISKDNEFIKSLIARGADCNAIDNEGLSCLHHAVLNEKNPEIVKILLENGATLTVASESHGTPASYTIELGNFKAFQFLMPFLTDENLRQKLGPLKQTLIQYCMSFHSDKILEAVVQLYKSRDIKINVNDVDAEGENLLMISIKKFHLRFLLENFIDEIDFELRNKSGQTFAHIIAFNVESLQQFFEEFPKLEESFDHHKNLMDKYRDTPIDCLISSNGFQVFEDENLKKLLLKRISFETLLEKFFELNMGFEDFDEMNQKSLEEFKQTQSENWYRISEAINHVKTFVKLLNNSPDKVSSIKNKKAENILHLICKINNTELIDEMLKELDDEHVELLVARTNCEGKKPFELLNDENKFIFEACFNKVK